MDYDWTENDDRCAGCGLFDCDCGYGRPYPLPDLCHCHLATTCPDRSEADEGLEDLPF